MLPEWIAERGVVDRVSILIRPGGRMLLLHGKAPCHVQGVSILIRPGGRMLLSEDGFVPSVLATFQSSSAPEGGCYWVSVTSCK